MEATLVRVRMVLRETDQAARIFANYTLANAIKTQSVAGSNSRKNLGVFAQRGSRVMVKFVAT